MLKHAAWLLNRYNVHSEGLTSYQRRWGKNSDAGICEFAETVHYQQPGKNRTNKLDPNWNEGLWLGRDNEANESLAGTSTRVQKVRSIRRLAGEEKYS